MKKLLTTAILAGATAFSFAQVKPQAGMNSLEVTFNPAAVFNSNSGGSTFQLASLSGLNQGIKYRMWKSENIAARGTFLLGLNSQTAPYKATNSQGEIVDLNEDYFEWAIQIRPGIENHFRGTDRLSPYLGSELILGFSSNSYSLEYLDANDQKQTATIKNGNSDFNGDNIGWRYVNGWIGGVGLLAGFDYYIAPSLYLGLEMNYAFVISQRNQITTNVPNQEETKTKQPWEWYFSPSLGANLRLGWNF
jgi:hypothetical protein